MEFTLTQPILSDHKKLLLNIGCGKSHISRTRSFFNDWQEIRADLYEEDADVRCDLVSMEGIRDQSFDCVWASHVLEHQYWHEVPMALNNIMRVLRNDGFAVIKVPDIGIIADRIKDSLIEPIPNLYGLAPIDFLYGARDRHLSGGIGELHKTGFTVKSLSMFLSELKIPAFIQEFNYEITAVCYKDKSPQEILDLI